jgi:hypothetical protein
LQVILNDYLLISAPIRLFMGAWELKRMLVKLFQFSERFCSGEVELEDTVAHLSSFTASFANIILELDSLDESYMENLERMVGTIFMTFPQVCILWFKS